MNSPGFQNAPNLGNLSRDAIAYYLSQGGSQESVDAYTKQNPNNPTGMARDAYNWYTDPGRQDTNTPDPTKRQRNAESYFGEQQAASVTPPPDQRNPQQPTPPVDLDPPRPPPTNNVPTPPPITPPPPQNPGLPPGGIPPADRNPQQPIPPMDPLPQRSGPPSGPPGYNEDRSTPQASYQVPGTNEMTATTADNNLNDQYGFESMWAEPAHRMRDGSWQVAPGYSRGEVTEKPYIDPRTGQPMVGGPMQRSGGGLTKWQGGVAPALGSGAVPSITPPPSLEPRRAPLPTMDPRRLDESSKAFRLRTQDYDRRQAKRARPMTPSITPPPPITPPTPQIPQQLKPPTLPPKPKRAKQEYEW